MPCRYLLDKPLLQSTESLFRECGYVDDRKTDKYGFMNSYILNAVLSYIEKKEQDLILGMRYNEWVRIDDKARDEIKKHIAEFIRKFKVACEKESRDSSENLTGDLMKEIDDNSVVEKSICYLYVFGIYGDCISRYLLINPPDGETKKEEIPDYDVSSVVATGNISLAVQTFNKCVETLKKWKEFGVRSRFIEIARDLYLLKQRFPDTPTFSSYMLVDRVFAYAYPREIPIGVYSADEALKEWEPVIRDFFNTYRNYLTNGSQRSEEEWNIFWDILSSFIREIFKDKRLYKFQVRGVKEAVRKLKGLVTPQNKGGRGYRTDYLIVASPTGSGKTEIMVLTILMAALARKVIFLRNGIDSEKNSPLAIIIYPRRALASDQVSRLIGYLYILNNKLNKKLNITNPSQKITLTIDYTDIRWKSEYKEAIKKIAEKNKNELRRYKLKVGYGVPAYYNAEDGIIELGFLTCPSWLVGNDDIYPRLKVVVNNGKYEIEDSKVYCGSYELDFIALTKNMVNKRLGDVHITIFETIRRRNLLNFKNYYDELGLFGLCRNIRNAKVFDHPLIIAVDEIHTYIDVPGVRYAFVLKRLLNRIRYNFNVKCSSTRGPPGTLIIGMSATIPHPEYFLSRLFLSDDIGKNISNYYLTIDRNETVPLGSEYFIITVPTRKAPVDALSVSIQVIMNTFYNIPSIPMEGGYVKRGIVFMEEFNALRRMRRELHNEHSGAIYRKIKDKNIVFGLQDLRNPRNKYFKDVTVKDYGDNSAIMDEISRGIISKVIGTKSWLDGELWWGYMLDTIVNYSNENKNEKNENKGIIYTTTKFNGVAEYSSMRREDVRGTNIIVSTSSLEVGVDYSDVVLIYQHGAPQNIAALIQRAGRGGRRMSSSPLMRIIVGIQLLPEEPRHSWLFEIFTRVEDIRKALDYDTLFLPIESEELQKQTMAELILESYALSKGEVKLTDNWECELNEWLDTNKDKVLEYSLGVFEDKDIKDIEDLIGDIKRHLDTKCNNQAVER